MTDTRLNDPKFSSLHGNAWDSVWTPEDGGPGVLYVGSSEVDFPGELFDAVVSVFSWPKMIGLDRETWLPAEGVPHLDMPLYDASAIPVKEIRTCVEFINVFMQRNETVLVRCQAGLNRSSIVAGAWLIHKAGMYPEEAIETIRLARGPQALFNQSFKLWLMQGAPWDLQGNPWE